jgi:hypothetical protein
MRALRPTVVIPGDNHYGIMARSGECLGMNIEFAVWRFGFRPGSEAAKAYGVSVTEGFYWYIAKRKEDKVVEKFIGIAIDLPDNFRRVIDDECPSAP